VPSRIIDQMPTLAQIENATDYEIVAWHLFLRPTVSNSELVFVKAVAARYERMPSTIREAWAGQARRAHEL
jgi:hypothetical protein